MAQPARYREQHPHPSLPRGLRVLLVKPRPPGTIAEKPICISHNEIAFREAPWQRSQAFPMTPTLHPAPFPSLVPAKR